MSGLNSFVMVGSAGEDSSPLAYTFVSERLLTAG